MNYSTLEVKFINQGNRMKGVIVAAGYGSRFLPASRVVPKELFPLIDKPLIAFAVEEFISAGIREIIIITSRRKKNLEDYFDRDIELERYLSQSLQELIKPPDIQVTFIRQTEMKGTGHALLALRPWIDLNDPFVVAYPDDLCFSEVPVCSQLIDRYDDTGKTVLATIYDPPHLENYGVLAINQTKEVVTNIIEKPSPGLEPSKEASIGRYLYTPPFLERLEENYVYHHHKNEYYHVYGLKEMMAQGLVTYKRIEGIRFDAGSKAGYLAALIHYARLSQDPQILEGLHQVGL